ncbi:MAG: C4-dicarboxylate ABC transporter [Spirochaetes bacterium]|jgi:TRAP-type C4-dicarboxylate transport system substrate-binding protein|nr:C4-dicarboxylate ABC transporter [Spirochaetota bacterium]
MKRPITTLAVAIAMLAVSAGSASAFTLKIASAAPESSPWGRALNRIAADWREISGGQVTLQIFHNGIAGEQNDIIRKMRIGQIQGALFTSDALALLSDEVFALSAPVLIRSDEELDYVFDRLRPDIEESIEGNQFEVIGWSKAGWVNFFANEPITRPGDLKDLALAVADDQPQTARAFRRMGYEVVPVRQNALLTSLNSGMIDAFYASPIAAAGFQWFARAQNMLDLDVAPFLGSFIVTQRSWRRVSEDIKSELVASVERQARRLGTAVNELETEAVETMREYGLNIIELSESERDVWFDEFERSLEVTVGPVFDEETYRRIQRYLDEYRR